MFDKPPANKMMNSDDVKKKDITDSEELFFFPNEGVTINAKSRQEAEEKLKTLLNKK